MKKKTMKAWAREYGNERYAQGVYDGRAETLKEVREMCEGMKVEKVGTKSGNTSRRKVNRYNAALDEIIRRLTQ